jgi:hypothetical protein
MREELREELRLRGSRAKHVNAGHHKKCQEIESR